jgi:hypothetical protein
MASKWKAAMGSAACFRSNETASCAREGDVVLFSVFLFSVFFLVFLRAVAWVRHDVRQLCGATHSPDGLASCDVYSRADATRSKLGNERCPDRQHAADADAGGSKMIRSRGKNENSGRLPVSKETSPCFLSVICF